MTRIRLPYIRPSFGPRSTRPMAKRKLTVIEPHAATHKPENSGRTPTGCGEEVTTKVTTRRSGDVPGEFGKWFEADTGGWPTLIVCVTLAAFIAAVALS